MIPKQRRSTDGKKIVEEAPVWYRASDQSGRGIVDPLHDSARPETQLLSSPTHIIDDEGRIVRGIDAKSRLLRKEMHALVGRFASREILTPSIALMELSGQVIGGESRESYVQRLIEMNGVAS